MTIKNVPQKPIDLRRLAAHADLHGNADGVANRREVKAQAADVARSPTGVVSDPIRPVTTRTDAFEKIVNGGGALPVDTLDPALRTLPPALRRLALEVDGMWGKPDGKITVDELDRVAKYYLAALPFFTKEAGALLELAEHLGFAKADAPATAKNVLSLRMAVAKVDKKEVAHGAQFRALFDEAVSSSDVPGVPGLLREAAEHNPKWHSLSILEHTSVAVAAIRELATANGREWKDAGAIMLLHDVGKVLGRNVVADPDGTNRYAFWGHEGAGAEWLRSKGLSGDLVFHVDHHADLRGSSVEEMQTLCGTKDRLAEAVLVYVSDQIAKGNKPEQLASFANERDKIVTLCELSGLDPTTVLATREALIEKWFSGEGAEDKAVR